MNIRIITWDSNQLERRKKILTIDREREREREKSVREIKEGEGKIPQTVKIKERKC